MDDQGELIDLQSCNATQLTVSGVKGEWSIKKNITGEVMQAFPSSIDDATMFSILDFSRKYELIALNEGIKFQKGKNNAVLVERIDSLNSTIEQLEEANTRLANILEMHTHKEI